MIKIVIAILALGVGVFAIEALWRNKIVQGEYSRKMVHIFAGVVIAFLPYFMSWHLVQAVGTISLITIVIVRKTGLIKSWYDIDRKSWGDVLGPASFLVFTFFEPTKLFFVFVCFHVAFSDGLAAIFGMKYGKSNQYKVLGYKKSVVGTAAFYVSSVLLLAGLLILGGSSVSISWLVFLVLPLASTLLENIAVFGIDNTLILAADVLIFNMLKVFS